MVEPTVFEHDVFRSSDQTASVTFHVKFVPVVRGWKTICAYDWPSTEAG